MADAEERIRDERGPSLAATGSGGTTPTGRAGSMDRERRLLQRVVAVAALVPVLSGLSGVVFGFGLTGDRTMSVSADSHFRYLSGLLLGIGLCFWSTIPSIEEKTTFFRFLTLVVVLGGLARLLGLWLTGLPSLTMLAALMMELIVTPALCLWQTRVANRYADETGVA
jgi:predicted MFS family arabinose efflux permease